MINYWKIGIVEGWNIGLKRKWFSHYSLSADRQALFQYSIIPEDRRTHGT